MAITTATRVPATKIYLEPGEATTCLAGAPVLAGHWVKVTTGGIGNHPKVIHTAALTDVVYGVAHHDANTGQEVSVLREGTVGVVAGEAIVSGDVITGGVAGVGMKALTNRVWGVATADIANAANGPVTLYL
jgi:predicted RecA/RadA family phage recombinase